MIAYLRRRALLSLTLSVVAAIGTVAVVTLHAASDPAAESSIGTNDGASANAAISPQSQADALHFVIAADRELYCRAYLAMLNRPPAAPNGGSVNPGQSWPLPAEMFRRAAESIQSKGAEFSFALRSLHPLEARNGPQTDLEQTGLAFVASHPGQNYYGRELLGGRRYVTAVYADLPAERACIDCHNRPGTTHRFEMGEVIGGIVVRVPLEL